jgi:hypothetical protein
MINKESRKPDKREEAVVARLEIEGSSIYADWEEVTDTLLNNTVSSEVCIILAERIREYKPEFVIVVDLYHTAFTVLVDAKCGGNKLFISYTGKSCVPNRTRVDEIIAKLKTEKNPQIEVIEHYFDGSNDYLPPTVENRRIV